jgi:hypothetical protein
MLPNGAHVKGPPKTVTDDIETDQQVSQGLAIDGPPL